VGRAVGEITKFNNCVSLVNQNWIKIEDSESYGNVKNWMRVLQEDPKVKKVLESLPEEVRAKTLIAAPRAGSKEEGKFVQLPGAEMGKVVVRFPPEASG